MRLLPSISYEKFTGLNKSSDTALSPQDIVGGYNFRINYDQSLTRARGYTREFFTLIGDIHMYEIDDIYFHDDMTDSMLVWGIDDTHDFNRVMYSYRNGFWLRVFFAVKVMADIAVGDTTIEVSSTRRFRVGDVIVISSKVSSETGTILTIDDEYHITLAAATTKAAANAVIAINDEIKASTPLHNRAVKRKASFLRCANWTTGNDTLYLEGSSIVVGSTTGIVALSFTDENQWLYDSLGGDIAEYVAPVGGTPLALHDRLWISGTGELANIVMFSERYRREFYVLGQGNKPSLNFIPVGGDSSGSGSVDDTIVGLESWAGEIIVFKKKSVHRIVGRYSTQFDTIEITNAFGCTEGDSIKRTKAGIIWKCRNKVMMWNGELNDLSTPRVTKILDNAIASEIQGGHINDRYYFLCTDDLLTLVYDVDTNTWGMDDVSYRCFATAQDGICYAIPRDGTAIFRLENGILRDGSTYNFRVEFALVSPAQRKIECHFDKAQLFAKTGLEKLTLYANVDGAVEYPITGALETFGRWGRIDEGIPMRFDDVPLKTCQFDLPPGATGYACSLTINESSVEEDITIERIELYFQPTVENKERQEP